MTVSELLTLAMKRVNILQAGQSPSPDDISDALAYANLWIDSLSIESLSIPFVLRSTFTMVSGQATYTVGVGGDVNIARPTIVNHVNYIDASLTPAIENELNYLTDDAYAAIPIKTLTNPLPSFYYWNPTYASGFARLSFWLVPTSSTLTGVIYAPSPIAQFSAATDTIVLPNGYQFFILENLAVFFGSTWRENLPIDPQLAQSAKDSKAAIKRINSRPIEMSVDPALTWSAPTSNFYTGP